MKRLTKSFIERYARENVGGLSRASKMPCYSYSWSADLCNMGTVLSKVKGSVCNKCYAKRGNYTWPATKEAHKRRIDSYLSNRLLWRERMLYITEYLYSIGETHFRWFDSGDIQDAHNLRDFLWISKRSPLKFWLPTKETKVVAETLKTEVIPDNTVIRVSAPMVGSRKTTNLSTIYNRIQNAFVNVKDKDVYQCPAPSQGNKCGTCRACWELKPVSYKEL